MEFRSLAALALVTALAVGGCSSNPEDKAAAPLVDALATLGLDGVTYERAYFEPAGLRLANARATLGGKPVAIGEIRANGFVATEGGWSAARIQALRVDGDLSAGEISLVGPKGPAGTRPGSGAYERFGAFGIKARLMGLPFHAARLDASSTAVGSGVDIDGLRLDDGLVADSPILGFAKGVDWQLRALVRQDSRNGLVAEVSDLRSARGVITGRIALSGLATDASAHLSSMDLRTLFDPDAWPDEVSLRDFRASIALTGPFPPSLSVPKPDRFADAYVASLVAAFERMLAAGRVVGEISAMPRSGIPVRGLRASLEGKDATAILGLDARVEGVAPVANRGGAFPSR